MDDEKNYGAEIDFNNIGKEIIVPRLRLKTGMEKIMVFGQK